MTRELADHDWTAMAERHRRELQVHCYRMMGSYEDSEDLVQETLLRAWRARDSFEGRSSFRAWLYRIATNACLDAIEQRRRRVVRTQEGAGEILWLEPYPDQLLEGIAPPDEEPDAAVVSKETIELTFMVAIQHLPPRQRAALILRDVLGWSATETASLLDTSVASANSALQRARATLKDRLPARRVEWAPGEDPSVQERVLVQRYVEATEGNDTDGLVALLSEDLRFSMPPEPGLYVGRDVVVQAWIDGGYGTPEFGEIRCLVTRANMQPAVANYVRREGDTQYRAMALDVLRIEDGAVAEIVAFPREVFPAFGLPQAL